MLKIDSYLSWKLKCISELYYKVLIKNCLAILLGDRRFKKESPTSKSFSEKINFHNIMFFLKLCQNIGDSVSIVD